VALYGISHLQIRRKGRKRNAMIVAPLLYIPSPGPIIVPNLRSLVFRDLDFTEIKSRSGALYNVLANGLRQRNSMYNITVPIGYGRSVSTTVSSLSSERML
jgi:hypothetical protein